MRLLFASILLLSSTAFATIAPKNDLKIYDTEFTPMISKSNYNAALDIIEKHYSPLLKAQGIKLVINRLWKDPTVNSDTDVGPNGEWEINSYGGLARYKGMSKLGYLFVACHELGHHMGGAPLYSGQDWASVEGEADYWASRCMKEVGIKDSDIAAAAQVLANVLADLGGEPVPQPGTPDSSVVDQTYEEHPQAQCRLDTYLKGLQCDATGPMSHVDPKVNSCYDYTTMFGVRPLCWFKP